MFAVTDEDKTSFKKFSNRNDDSLFAVTDEDKTSFKKFSLETSENIEWISSLGIKECFVLSI